MSDPILVEVLQRALVHPLGGPVSWRAETGSTNDDVAALARNGAPEGAVIGADHQTAGKGRRGREWTDAAATSVAMSVLLRPGAGQSPGLLPLVVALGIADGMAPLVADEIQIVWPNDLVIQNRKCTGILCEMGWQGTGVEWAVAGVGINVHSAPEAVEGARFVPTSLAEHGLSGSRTDVVIAALQGLSGWYSRWQSMGSAPVLEAYRKRDAIRGREVTVSIDDPDGTQLVGTAGGIDPQGRLIVTTLDAEHRLSAAEVQHVRR